MAGDTYVTDLSEGTLVDATFAVQRKQRRHTRNGDPFLSMELADRTGRVPGVVWNDVNLLGSRFDQGDTVRVLGRVESYGGRLQIAVRDVEKIETGDPLDLVPGARRDAETLEGFVEFLAGEISHPGLRALLDRFLSDPHFRERLRSAPAAETHHDYAGGLLEHTVAVATLAHDLCQLHPKLNSDLLLTAAIVHDLGRTEEYTYGAEFGLTDEGRLLGHIQIGQRILTDRAAELDDERRLALLHCVLCHHGPEQAPGRRFASAEAIALYRLNALDGYVKGVLEHGLPG
jgi:3'-5' exoribonuclease